MSRELLWRRYPTDQRGTYFRRFWDTRGLAGAPAEHLPPIHTWDGERRLGENFTSGGGRLVLLIRGELLRRYPGAVIYAARGATDNELEPVREEHFPLFRGTLEPDITFLGFELSEVRVRGEDGWFFVIEQQPTEPRFGLDVATEDDANPGALTSWADLSWSHMAAPGEDLDAISHVGVGGALAGRVIDDLAWGRNGAHMAAVTLQAPVRIAVTATAVLPPLP